MNGLRKSEVIKVFRSSSLKSLRLEEREGGGSLLQVAAESGAEAVAAAAALDSKTGDGVKSEPSFTLTTYSLVD